MVMELPTKARSLQRLVVGMPVDAQSLWRWTICPNRRAIDRTSVYRPLSPGKVCYGFT